MPVREFVQLGLTTVVACLDEESLSGKPADQLGNQLDALMVDRIDETKIVGSRIKIIEEATGVNLAGKIIEFIDVTESLHPSRR